jgi:hypothetical protein
MSRVQVLRGVMPRLYHDIYEMEVITTCGPDDQFSSPKQIRWAPSIAGGKLLVANGGTTVNAHLRGADLGYYSKFYQSSTWSAIDSDQNYIYSNVGTTTIRRFDHNFGNYEAFTILAGNARMIEFSGDPLYGYVSIASTDHHGVQKIRKSDMTVVASIEGAAGSGDGAFNNPLGLKYYGGKLYVCDETRVIRLDASSDTLTWDSTLYTTTSPYRPNDIDTDGTYWYMVVANGYLWKKNFDFSQIGAGVNIASNGYSLCIIPDQGDGYSQTLAVCSNTNSNLKRHRCSDLSLINTVGSAGTGADSLFDLTLTTSVATKVTYLMDDGWSYEEPTASTSHALLWNGIAGYTFRTAGPHKVTIRVAGGLGLVTAINGGSDFISGMKNLRNCKSLATLDLSETGISTGSYAPLRMDLSEIPKSVSTLTLDYCQYVTGSLINLPRNVSTIILGYAPVVGSLADLPTLGVGTQYIYYCTNIIGSLADIPFTIYTLRMQGCTGITAGSLASQTSIRSLVIHSMGWSSASVDIVLLSISDAIHANAAHFTYATPAIQIGGTNAAPGGTASAATTSPLITPGTGNSNSDWLWDADLSKHKALTGTAAIWVMRNNVGHAWTVSATGVGGAEMLSNPGFETWTTDTDVANWTEAVTGAATISKESSLKMDGSYAVKLVSDGADSAVLVQSQTVVAGSTYRLQFWTRGDGTYSGYYRVYDNSHSANLIATTSTGVTGTTYTLVSVDFTAPTGCTSISLSVRAPQTAGGIAYFDDASHRLIGGAG